MTPAKVTLGEALRIAREQDRDRNRKARYRRYYHDRREEMQERKRVYYRENKERVSASNRAYYNKRVEKAQQCVAIADLGV